jgi:hypothetical protein
MNSHKKAQDAQKESVERCEAFIRKVRWQVFGNMLRPACFVAFMAMPIAGFPLIAP